jgi:hypothetical protein
MAAIETAVVEDQGGADECSEVQRALIADFAFAVTLRDLLAAHLAAVGPLTAAGKRRAALTSWQQASARVEALAGKIGLQRRAAPVPSLSQYLEQREAAKLADQAADAGKRAPEPPQDARSSKDAGEDTPGAAGISDDALHDEAQP